MSDHALYCTWIHSVASCQRLKGHFGLREGCCVGRAESTHLMMDDSGVFICPVLFRGAKDRRRSTTFAFKARQEVGATFSLPPTLDNKSKSKSAAQAERKRSPAVSRPFSSRFPWLKTNQLIALFVCLLAPLWLSLTARLRVRRKKDGTGIRFRLDTLTPDPSWI